MVIRDYLPYKSYDNKTIELILTVNIREGDTNEKNLSA